ncbi:conserved hypothetical protein [[Clostridium] ultunense Esp]|uniref:hypothetical protein n=1 Tax=Thermicanus aegyptius TaxID=94009 RepID=UPI0002B6F0EE|nr:hypothetical protein [Thermicanus aegyptius]CCQ98425.1 conserved hypothetical protein [[Clostridium] ultunense Esp]
MGLTFEQILEFRGISLNEHLRYLSELGFLPESLMVETKPAFPLRFYTSNWKVEILREEKVRITSTFIVEALFFRFQSDTEEGLNHLISLYRKKTMRAGG